MPRLYREAPLNSVWEGSGNVNALDVLRAMAREPECVEAFFTEVALADDARITSAVSRPAEGPRRGGRALSAGGWSSGWPWCCRRSLLVRHAPAAVADAFCTTRLGGDWGSAFGTLPRGLDLRAIIDRAAPVSG